MSRVAVLDAANLDGEISQILWTRVKANLGLHFGNHEEEGKFLLDSILFLLAATQIDRPPSVSTTTTYGSRLSGVTYRCSKRTLYVATILMDYLLEKWSRLIITQHSNQKAPTIIQLASIIYKLCDTLLFCCLIASSEAPGGLFPSIKHRLFNIRALYQGLTRQRVEIPTPYENAALVNMQTESQQLLWNGVLELLNTAVLKNRRVLIPLMRKLRSLRTRGETEEEEEEEKEGVTNKVNVSTDSVATCAQCKLFPINPYQMSCCSGVYCYVCAVKALEWRRCSACKRTSNLRATPIYNQ